MKAVLVGTDLMYRQDGKLVPIEMNTQVGLNNSGRLENYEDFLDFSNLVAFIQSNNITDVYLEGAVSIIKKYWPEELQDVNVSVVAGFKEEYDEPGKLYVRTRYSDEALVDAFCRDKVEFLKSIKDKDFGSEFIVKTLEGLEGEITALVNNGDLPNFIVKYRYPAYDRSEYPKLLKFRTLRELNSWVKSNLEQDYFIMPFYFNESKLYEGRYGKRLKVMRNWSLFLSEDGTSLTSLDLGTYTRFTEEILDENSREYDGHVLVEGRKQLLVGTGEYSISDLLAEKDDLILMTDGTWKEVQDLKIGEEVKAVSFGDKNLRLAKSANYGSLEDLVSTSEYIDNKIVGLQKIVGFYNEVNLTFEDGSDWFDTEDSAYPVVVSENEIRFKELKDIEVGDSIILIPVSAENEEKPSFIVKEVTGISKERKEQEGYSLSLNGNHLFLSRTSEDSAAYIAIEHNADQSITDCGNMWESEWSQDNPCTNEHKKYLPGLITCGFDMSLDSVADVDAFALNIILRGLGQVVDGVLYDTGYRFTVKTTEGGESGPCGDHCWFKVVPIFIEDDANWQMDVYLLDENLGELTPEQLGKNLDIKVTCIKDPSNPSSEIETVHLYLEGDNPSVSDNLSWFIKDISVSLYQ